MANANIEITARDKTARAFNTLRGRMDRMTGQMKSMLGPVLALAGPVGFGALVKNTLNFADAIGKTADKIGVSTSALQELRFAAEQSGVSTQALDMGLQRFVRRTAEAAQGTGVLVKEYERLGIELKNSDGSLRSAEDVLGDYADAIANTKDSSEQLRLAFAAFDSEGAALVNLFRNGKIGVEGLRQELRDLGGVLSEDLIRKSEKANDALNRMSKAMGGALKTAIASLAPVIERAADWFVELTKRVRTFFESLIPLAERSSDSLARELAQVNEKVGGLRDRIAELEQPADSFLGKLDRWTTHLPGLRRQLEQAQERQRELREELNNSERAADDLRRAAGGLGEGLGDLGDAAGGAAKEMKALHDVIGQFATGSLKNLTSEWNRFRSAIEGRYTASMDTVLDLWDKLIETVPGFGKAGTKAVDDVKDSLFDMDEAMKQVQNNIQSGFSDLFVDIFSGKGIDSVKDFAKRVLDIFKRLIADIAAAWLASRIFKLPANFGGGFNIGDIIGGGGGGGLGKLGEAIGGAIAKGGDIVKGIAGGIKSVFGGGGLATAAGNLGFKGPAAFATQAGTGGLGVAAGGALVGGIAAFGFSQISANRRRKQDANEQFFGNVGTGTFEQLNPVSAFRGMDEATGEFFVTINEGWNPTLKALSEANLLIKAQGALYDEAGNELVKLSGNAEGVKTALANASATGFEFGGSLTNAIEKGNNLRVSIQGDADAIKSALQAATAIGIGGFHSLEETATGVSATLTGDMQKWNDFLQAFVNQAVQAAISGVGALGREAGSATQQFLELAKAASSVNVGAARQPAFPKFAGGGITSGPSIAGEAGPEAIVPLGGGRSIPVKNLDGGSSAKSEKLLQQIYQEVRKQNTRILALERR